MEDNEKVAIFVGMNDDRLFELLRSALNGEAVECELSAKDWECIYLLSQRQSVTGVLWPVVKDRALPMAVAMQWLALAEQIRGMNELQNREAARLTQLFADAGHRSAILKGQANARLYPDKLLRQPGDIDIWIEGELEVNSVRKESLLTAADGKNYRTKFYNLDVIISVGYRVKSQVGTRFRQWANAVLKDYLLRGYAVHQQAIALQQINLRIDAQNERLARIEDTIDQQQQQLDFVVRGNEKPEELIIPTGCVWDAYAFVCDLIRSAQKRLVLIDNFVDERVLTMLDKRAEGVEASVYTRYHEQTKLDFEKHNQQCAAIGFVQLPHAVHDRYLIVDDDVWLLGASVKDMGRSLCTVIKVGFTPDMVMGLAMK